MFAALNARRRKRDGKYCAAPCSQKASHTQIVPASASSRHCVSPKTRAQTSPCHGPVRRPAVVRLAATAPPPTPPAAPTPPPTPHPQDPPQTEVSQKPRAQTSPPHANVNAPRTGPTSRNCPAGRDRAIAHSSGRADAASDRDTPLRPLAPTGPAESQGRSDRAPTRLPARGFLRVARPSGMLALTSTLHLDAIGAVGRPIDAPAKKAADTQAGSAPRGNGAAAPRANETRQAT